jgi:glucose-1-phosphate thymidylyltransferase
MNVLILAAGYATRLYPLTQTKAKPLLEVAGKPMIEWVVDNLAPISEITGIFVVTNAKFAADFQSWADGYAKHRPSLRFKIINDGSTDDSNKLGAIGDIQLVVERENLAAEDLIVVAGDNLFSESLDDFGAFCRANNQPVLGVHEVENLDEAKKYGVVAVDAAGAITSFEEKPAAPKSRLIGIALYFYPAKTVADFSTYLAEGNNADQPGRFVQWLYRREPVLAWKVPGTWFDIGSKETLADANRIFARFTR